MSKKTIRYRYTQNRELSWLRFNRRVLEEASDSSVPALERLKFVSIFSSNLDEFFMVRVGSLFDLARMMPNDKDSKTGWTPKEQLHHIYDAVPALLTMKKQIYRAIMEELNQNGIRELSPSALMDQELKQVNHFFRTELLPILSPILIGPDHPVPHLINKHLYAAAFLKNKKGQPAIGIVPVPDKLSPYLLLSDGMQFIRTENILLQWMPMLFENCTVEESCILTVTRNADLSFDDEKFEDDETDFRHQMKKLLKKRDHLSVVRLELSTSVSSSFQKLLSHLIHVEDSQIFIDSCPLDLSYTFRLIDELPKSLSVKLTYPPSQPRWAEDLNPEGSMISQIQKKDRLLFYPYDSVKPFLQLLNEAAENPEVTSIKITIYRLASSSRIAQALCRAADNGKEVLVLMELRARFDEENNLIWSKMLEESGCQVIYGIKGFKCHSKICLITLQKHHKTRYLTQIGTGNYNEKTNALYTDLSLMTADRSIGEDAALFFRNMPFNQPDGDYQQLCISPFGIKSMLKKHIDEQIRLGKDGYICIKTNAVTECTVIDKLVDASRAGVEIQLIVRGICCLLPGIPTDTENIHVTSIVGRFLEHDRIYQFGRDENAKFYISSADLMTRNLNRRVEIACPVYDSQSKKQLRWILNTHLNDTAKASFLLQNGNYQRKFNTISFDSQAYFMQESPHSPAENIHRSPKLTQRFRQWTFRILKNKNT